jgi:hypothetical protein
MKADMEAERLGQLKAGGMKETDFKKQAEVDETIAHAHIETDTDVATETITSKGHVDRKWVILISPVHFLCFVNLPFF